MRQKIDCFLEPPKGVWPCQHLDLGLLTFTTGKDLIFATLATQLVTATTGTSLCGKHYSGSYYYAALPL